MRDTDYSKDDEVDVWRCTVQQLRHWWQFDGGSSQPNDSQSYQRGVSGARHLSVAPARC